MYSCSPFLSGSIVSGLLCTSSASAAGLLITGFVRLTCATLCVFMCVGSSRLTAFPPMNFDIPCGPNYCAANFEDELILLNVSGQSFLDTHTWFPTSYLKKFECWLDSTIWRAFANWCVYWASSKAPWSWTFKLPTARNPGYSPASIFNECHGFKLKSTLKGVAPRSSVTAELYAYFDTWSSMSHFVCLCLQ